MKYIAELRNNQGCTFDTLQSDNLATIKAWARSRGGKYTLIITANNQIGLYYSVSNNRLTAIKY
jgi:hypothetical protein